MERDIMTWQREGRQDGLHPLFDDILRRQLMLDAEGRRRVDREGVTDDSQTRRVNETAAREG